MEMESDGKLPFLDILIHRKRDGTLGHSVYRKPTHTDLYLNGKSHHHPSQKMSVLSTLIHRAISISDKDNLHKEICHLKKTFIQNGYNHRHIDKALKRAFGPTKASTKEKTTSTTRAFIPYVSTISGKISRILRKFDIDTIHLPPAKLKNQLVKAKDPIGLKTSGVYSIPCECGQTYIGETSRTIETRVKEHRRHLRLGQPEKSALAEHSLHENHNIHWEETKRLCHSNGYWDRLVKEAIQIKLHDRTMNRDCGYNISKTWDHLLKIRKDWRPIRRDADR
jgi:hypothetical protein